MRIGLGNLLYYQAPFQAQGLFFELLFQLLPGSGFRTQGSSQEVPTSPPPAAPRSFAQRAAAAAAARAAGLLPCLRAREGLGFRVLGFRGLGV